MRKRFLNEKLATLRAFAVLAGACLAAVACGSSSEPGLLGPGQSASTQTGGAGTVGDGTTPGGVSGTELSACSGSCVDLLTDSANCGTCGNACEAGTQCKSGQCAGCSAGQTDCTGTCVNTNTDNSNCGACGNACNLGSRCVAGVCEGCADGQMECNGTCVDVQINPQNCGACGNACGDNEVCSNGACRENSCGSADELPCGADGQCVNAKWDKENCGACGQACTGDLGCFPPRDANGNQLDGISRCGCGSTSATACGDKCVETNTDQNNCGSCGNVCPSAQYCEQGVCRCGGDQVLCDGTCKNADQCGGGSTNAQAPLPQPQSIDRDLQLLPAPSGDTAGAAMTGDGSVDCTPTTQPIDGGDGDTTDPTNPTPGTGGMSGGTDPVIPTNPTAGAHCGGDEWFEGKSTWYELATPLVHCSYPTNAEGGQEGLPMYYGALNDAQYAVADVCGACVEIEAEGKTLEVEIVDECPYVGNETWCYAGSNHIDLNPAAFNYFADPVKGVFDIRWRFVPCSAPGELQYTFKAGSSIYWTGIMIRNHPVPLASVEVAGPDGSFKALERQEYNYWLLESGFGAGPYTLRVTDTSGAVIEKSITDSLPTTELATNETHDFGSQLASCQ